MGSVNPHFRFNRVGTNYSYYVDLYQNEPKEYTSSEKEKEAEGLKENTLVILINSVYYFLECVYIIKKNSGYQLIAIHNGRVLTYRNYSSLKGAKIAFHNLYRSKAWQMGVKAKWTHPYPPNCHWLEEKDEFINQSMKKKPLKAYSI